ncbi:tRNA (guanosine(37)-N1)-methyltransferase TrmD [Candidatus Poribacteria bacterium]|nr:tRNA (guanosine(37)-N1)-methyltransferase TrmD [Candidatus Poribacteria bacterium]
MRIDVITLFPGMFVGPLSEGIIGRAINDGIVSVHIVNLRDFCEGKHRQADDKPYGGGAGMVLMAEPMFKAVESLSGENPLRRVVLTSAQGSLFSQAKARELATEESLVIICGRYEGIDERVATGLNADEISIGDYVLSGGELPALVIIDAVARLIPGVVGSPESIEHDSFSKDLLGYPQFTRPPHLRGLSVPDVLISGHHAEIAKWRRREAIRKTFRMRRGMLAGALLAAEEQEFVRQLEKGER